MGSRKSAISARQASTHRKLFLVDIENIVGKPIIGAEDVASVKRWATDNLGLSETDSVVVGTSGDRNCLAAMTAWRGVRHVLKKGHDGADLALIGSARDYRVDSFEEVVIMSGDGVFAPLADQIASLGAMVTVVSARASLSSKLADPSFRLRLFNPRCLEVA